MRSTRSRTIDNDSPKVRNSDINFSKRTFVLRDSSCEGRDGSLDGFFGVFTKEFYDSMGRFVNLRSHFFTTVFTTVLHRKERFWAVGGAPSFLGFPSMTVIIGNGR